MTRLALLLALLAALTAATAATAQAGGRVIRVDSLSGVPESFLTGPALAGERVAWAGRMSAKRYHVSSVRLDGTAPHTRTVTVDARRGSKIAVMDLAASPRRMALGLTVERCVKSCRTSRFGVPTTEFQGLLSAPAGGPFDVVREGCGGGSVCSEICTRGTGGDVSADAVAYTVCDGPLRVRDFGDGANPVEREFPGRYSGRIADSILAARFDDETPEGDPVIVTDWRTGDDLYTAEQPDSLYDFDVEDDGTLVTLEQTGDERRLFRRSPEDPAPHPVGPPLDRQVTQPATVRLVGDRIAYARRQPKAGSAVYRYGVRTLAGEDVVGPVKVEGDLAIDFDGERLVWRTSPCAVVAVAVWDLAGDPPHLPAGQCPFARIVPGSGRIDGERRVSVDVACPPTPAIGCPGAVTGVAKQSLVRWYSLEPGESARVRVGTRRSLCIDSEGRTIARLKLLAQRRNKSSWRVRGRRVALKGPQPDVRRCKS